MIEGRRQAGREGVFLGVLALVCAALTVLQFRWTGELARAEFDRLAARQGEAAEDFCRGFEEELEGSIRALVPDAGELTEGGIAARVEGWRERGFRPVFRRVALAIPEGGEVGLREVDLGTGAMKEVDWPESWSGLRRDIERRARGGGAPPSVYEGGALMEYPIRGRPRREEGRPPMPRGGPGGERGGRPDGPGGPGGPEAGWMIFELDARYLRTGWLPELARRSIGTEGREFYRVEVRDASGETVFAEGPAKAAGRPVVREFHRPGGGPGFGGGPPGRARWRLEMRYAPGELEKVVAAARRRNLALAAGANGLILAAGWALVVQARRSRLLAEERMNFVANVSHELRTPLTVIQGAAQNLKRGIVRTPEGLERYSELILEHAGQLGEMVQQVLDFSSAKRGGRPAVRELVDVGRLLQEAVGNVGAETAGCEVALTLPEGRLEVEGEPGALRRAFQNLVVNAAKHGGEGRWIGISAKGPGERVEVTVSDRGPGVPKEEQEEIFTPFFRGEAAQEAQRRGSGLGLALVKEIVEAHGGRVSVCSGAEGGASFTVSLPVRAERPMR